MGDARSYSKDVAALSDQASDYLEQARQVAVSQFGSEAVKEIPLLVVQTAQLMASLDQNRLLQRSE